MKELVWYDKVHYIAMLASAAAMPVGFHAGLWAAGGLAVASLIKIVASRTVGNRSLPAALCVPLVAAMVYWVVCLLSVLRGGDAEAGLRVVELKAVLLVYALCFLLTDTSYLTTPRIRWLFGALLAAVCASFAHFAVAAGARMAAGESLKAVTNSSFDSRHHAYVALYAVTALAFAAAELLMRWGRLRGWWRALLLAGAAVCVVYVMLVNSRAGVVAMSLVVLICLCYHAATRRRWVRTAVAAVVVAGLIAGVGVMLPGHTNRIRATIETVRDAGRTDARLEINKAAAQLALRRPLLGYGVGAYREALVGQYEANGFEAGTKSGYNAHNQYMETLLATGVVGLVPLLVFLLMPLGWAIARRRWVFPMLLLTTVVCANMLFESMLERQMGLLFVGFFMPLNILLINTEENKFGQLAKK